MSGHDGKRFFSDNNDVMRVLDTRIHETFLPPFLRKAGQYVLAVVSPFAEFEKPFAILWPNNFFCDMVYRPAGNQKDRRMDVLRFGGGRINETGSK